MARHGGGVADDRDDGFLECGVLDRPSQERQGVHAPGSRVDDLGIVVLPAGLVLRRAVVVVDREQHRVGLLRGGAEVDRRLAAVGADLEQRTDARRSTAQLVQGEALVMGHESLGGPGHGQCIRSHTRHASPTRARLASAMTGGLGLPK